MVVAEGLGGCLVAGPITRTLFPGFGRYGFGCCRNLGKVENGDVSRKIRGISALDCSSHPDSRDPWRMDFYKETIEVARDNFTREVSIRAKDQDISLARALLYVGTEDEAFLALNRETDRRCFLEEYGDTSSASTVASVWEDLGKNMDSLLEELDIIAKDVEAELVSRDIGCHTEEILDAVNKVLFQIRGFKRSPLLLDPKCSYLHSALSSRWASAIMLSVIYIEVCRRLHLTIVGSRVGEEFLIWPSTGNPEELFRAGSGGSLFKAVNGNCVDDPRSKASDINSSSLSGLDIATNRDIIGIALANLIRLYWKRASRASHGLMLTSPLRKCGDKFNTDTSPQMPLLRPLDLSLAVMASERSLILQPHNWALRRDLGMMLYYTRDYEGAVQELSICMALAPEEEAEILEPFVEKLHLMRLERSWGTLEHLATH